MIGAPHDEGVIFLAEERVMTRKRLAGATIESLGETAAHVVTHSGESVPEGQIFLAWKKGSIYESLYDALRGLYKAQLRYGARDRRGESQDMKRLHDLVHEIHGMARENELPLDRLRDSYDAVAEAMQNCRNDLKKDAGKKAAAGEILTPYGKMNKGANRARLNAIRDRLHRRYVQVYGISKSMGKCEAALAVERHRCLQVLRAVVERLDEEAASLMSGAELGCVRLTDSKLTAFMTLAENLRSLKASPFVNELRHVVGDFERIGTSPVGRHEARHVRNMMIQSRAVCVRLLVRDRIEQDLFAASLAAVKEQTESGRMRFIGMALEGCLASKKMLERFRHPGDGVFGPHELAVNSLQNKDPAVAVEHLKRVIRAI